MADPVKNLENKSKLDELMKNNPDKLIVVKFYAQWCGPCKLVAPKYKKMAADFAKDVIFCKIDVEEETCEELLDLYQVRVTPTFVLIKKGVKVASMHGNVMNELSEAVKKHK